MYIKLLCKCNRAGVSFFNSSLPLGLVYFLVKNTLQTSTPENEELVRCLCLYTLCHSYLPIGGEHGRLLKLFTFKFKHACIYFISITQTAHRTYRRWFLDRTHTKRLGERERASRQTNVTAAPGCCKLFNLRENGSKFGTKIGIHCLTSYANLLLHIVKC